MHSLNIELSDTAYAALAAAAKSNGRPVEAIAADQLEAYFADELAAGFWTSERMDEMRAAAAEIKAGNFLTSEQVEDQLSAHRVA